MAFLFLLFCPANPDLIYHNVPVGDSGGGLMSRDAGGRWYLLGIVSTGPAECGLTPVIYHNVTYTLPWIASVMTGGAESV
jgi:secreted trypsin-like serine protease